jgi:imidazolonepropionase-like amidohydrolase
MINKQDQVGTIGVGKFADVLIVSDDDLPIKKRIGTE